MANVQIDVDTTAFTISEKPAELDYGITYTYWGWGDGEIIEWGNEEYLFYTRAFSRNWDTLSFDWTPEALELQTTYQLDAGNQSFLIDAKDVTLSDVNIPIDADTIAYTVTGSAVTLTTTYILDADTDAFSVSASAVELLYSANVDLFADTAAYQVTGSAVNLEIGYNVDAATAAWAVTGTAVELDKGVTLDADTAAFSITEGAATFPYTRSISADVSRIQVLGGDIGLSKAGGITTFGKFDSTAVIKPEKVSERISAETTVDRAPVITTSITIPRVKQGTKAA